MLVDVTCPTCQQAIAVSTAQMQRGSVVSCPQCGHDILVAGRFLSDLFWAANNSRRDVLY